jgi:hypothetical protein
MVFVCDAYDAVREHFWYLFEEFAEWESLRDTVRPGGRCLAEFTQQRSYTIASLHVVILSKHGGCLMVLTAAPLVMSKNFRSWLKFLAD